MAKALKRKIVRIDEEKCDGCGLCVPSCAEGAIRMVDGKARLVAANLCDGLGNCVGTCPRGAIIIEEQAADPLDARGVVDHLAGARRPRPSAPAGGCPGARLQILGREGQTADLTAPRPATHPQKSGGSRLGHWPIQLALVPVTGPLWAGGDVLISADCVPFALAGFHDRLLAGRTVAVGCPKLDDAHAHAAKLAKIIAGNDIRSITIARMEVPCCGGLTRLVEAALEVAGRGDLPTNEVIVAIDGSIKGERKLTFQPDDAPSMNRAGESAHCDSVQEKPSEGDEP